MQRLFFDFIIWICTVLNESIIAGIDNKQFS